MQLTDFAASIHPEMIMFIAALMRTRFLVLRNGYQQYSNDHNQNNEFKKYMIPKFARIRVVKIVKYNDEFYLVCSCGYFDRFGLGCRHVYKIRGLPPMPEDSSVRYRIDYLRYFNKPGFEDLTTRFDECLQKEPLGIPLCQQCMFIAVGVGDAPHDLLSASASQIRPGTHWHTDDKESVSPDQDAVSTNKKRKFEETQPLLEQAVGLSQYAQEDEGETEMIGNGSQFAEQGDEGTQECIADETEIGNESRQDEDDEGRQELIATIDITEGTSQELEEFRQATIGSGPYLNAMPLYQQMANCDKC
jgi:hypothetical protein